MAGIWVGTVYTVIYGCIIVFRSPLRQDFANDIMFIFMQSTAKVHSFAQRVENFQLFGEMSTNITKVGRKILGEKFSRQSVKSVGNPLRFSNAWPRKENIQNGNTIRDVAGSSPSTSQLPSRLKHGQVSINIALLVDTEDFEHVFTANNNLDKKDYDYITISQWK